MAIDVNADFTPTIPDSGVNPTKIPYNPTGSFKFWAQKVLPLVYDDSLSYYEVLCKVVDYLNNVIQNVDNLNDSVDSTNSSFQNLQSYVNDTKDALINAYNELQGYVNTYFDNLDVQQEINEKLDAMADSGELSTLIVPFLPDVVSAWLNAHITPTSPTVDNTLSVSGAAADAKVTGDKLTVLTEDLSVVQKATFSINDSLIYSGYSIGSTGYHPTSDSYDTTGFIPVKQGEIIKYHLKGINASTWFIAFYTDTAFTPANFSSANSVASVNGESEGEYTVPSNGYIVFVCAKNYTGSVTFEDRLPGYVVETDAKVTVLTEDLITVQKATFSINDSLIYSGYKISSTGYHIESEDYDTTGLIPVKQGETIKYHLKGVNTTTWFIAFYTGTAFTSANFSSANSVASVSGESEGEYTVPSNGYIAFVCAKNYTGSVVFEDSLPDYVAETDATVISIDKTNFILDDAFIENKKLTYPDAYTSSSDDWQLTDYIPVSSGEQIAYELEGVNATASLIVFYDTSKVKQTSYSVQSINGVVKGCFVAPDNGFVRFCASTHKKSYVFFYDYKADAFKNVIGKYPAYWIPEVDTSIASARANELTIGENIVEFVFLTDTHWINNAQHSPALIEDIINRLAVDMVVFGGDVITGTRTTRAEALAEVYGFYGSFGKNTNLLATIGNHDLNNNTSNPDEDLTLSEAYALYLRRSERFMLTDKSVYGSVYDNDSQKVRIVQFLHPTSSYTNADVTAWVLAKIAEKTGWTVIVISHAYWNSKLAGTDLSVNTASVTLANSIADALATNNNTGFWLCGHTHRDYNTTITSNNNNTLTIMCTTTDAYKYGATDGGPAMTLGTTTEQAFDILQVDTSERKIYATRVGAGDDRVISY